MLLAEDVELNAEIMLGILSVGEMESDHTENGKNAVQMFGKSAAGTYTAILMDVRKTEIDGPAAATAISVAVGDAFRSRRMSAASER